MRRTGSLLNILWLWPDILNLHGDRGNVMALVRMCGLYGIDAAVSRVNHLTDGLNLKKADIILMGAGELAVMPRIAGALSKSFEELMSWTENGGVIFVTGTTGTALGVDTLRADGSHIFGLGLFDMECRERSAVLGDDLIFCLEGAGSMSASEAIPSTITGLQIQMMDVSLNSGQPPFGKTVYGYGNDGGGTEGAITGSAVFTNALGPVLVKNPWLTFRLMKKALEHNSPEAAKTISFDPGFFELEFASAEAIKRFNDTKKRPK